MRVECRWARARVVFFSEKGAVRENARARVSIVARVAAHRLRTSGESGGLRVARVAGERVH